MTRTLEDLETFWRAIMIMKPWEYDHSVSPHMQRREQDSRAFRLQVLPIPWREINLSESKPLRWGVLWDDGRCTCP